MHHTNKRVMMAVFATWGALSAAVAGCADALVGLGRAAPEPTARPMLIASLVSAAIYIPFGALFGTLVAISRWTVLSRVSLWHLKRTLLRPLPILLGALLLIALSGGIAVIGYKKGIQIDAVDFRPLWYAGIIATGTLIGGARFARHAELARYTAPLVVAFGFGVMAAGLPLLSGYPGLLQWLDTRTLLAGPVLGAIRKGFDRDGDGFATVLCERDCDCDDVDKNRNPAAIDVPGNGREEDCSGSDLAQMTLMSPASKESPDVRAILKGPRNIVLITIDTLRADHLHCYGYSRQTTPHLDRFASESVRFAEVRSQGPSTRFIFPVFLTGRYFPSLALHKGEKWYDLDDKNVTFAEILKGHGYRTVAVLPYFRFKEHSGFQQGFDIWEPTLGSERDATWEPTGDLVTDRGIRHLAELVKKGGPWLLWLHYFDPHGSYVRHPEQPSFGTTRADLYDGEILYVDRQVQRFFDALKSNGLWDETAIVMASDHGEGIGLPTDHGFNYHGFSLFDSEVRVPLMIKIPGSKPHVVKECVGTIDVMPTLLALGGIEAPANVHGVSLMPYLFGQDITRGPIMMHLPGEKPEEGLVSWPYKLIWQERPNRYSLYNLETDPNEQHDLIDEDPVRAKTLKDMMGAMRYEIRK